MYTSQSIFLLICLSFFVSARSSADDHFKVGITVPFSGSSAEYGGYIREGFELAHSFSPRRKTIDLIFEDDECSGSKGAAATQKLIEIEKVDLIFGGFCSAVVLAQVPLVQRSRIVQMANAVAPQIREAGEWVYRINADGEVYLRALVPFLVTKKVLKRWAVLHVVNDFGNSQSEIFRKLARESGGTITAVEEYLLGLTDFRAQLTKIRRSRPEGVFIVGYGESTNAIRQMSEMGLSAVIAASTPFDNPNLWALVGEGAADIYFPSSFDPGSNAEAMTIFRQKYQERFSSAPTQYAMMGYEAFTVFERLMDACGHDRNCMSEHLDHDTFPGVQGDLRFDEFGDAVRPIYVKRLRGGKVDVER